VSDVARVLIVEDDENLRLALQDNLEAEGYAVRTAATAAEARRVLDLETFDVLVLDIMLPDADGYRLCGEVRERGLSVRVLMLTARTLEDDLVRGFDAGADDYLTKPYRLRELLARVGSLARRGRSGAPTSTYRFAGFELDARARTLVGPDATPLTLTRTEFDLLLVLLRNSGCAMTRPELLSAVWGDVIVDERTVDNFVSNLKRKLGWKEDAPYRIQTLRGVGYRMELD
jgi:DNA-binding response OmpR family regulator